MTRDEFIIESYDQEIRRLSDLSEDIFLDKPREGCEVEWEACGQRLGVIEQMIEEIPMDYIVDDKETGLLKQVFIGKIEDEPVQYVNSRNFTDMHYYIDLIIKGCGDEEIYKYKRFLRLSSNIWKDWFEDYKYEEEKELRIANNLCIYVKTTVIDGEVREIDWYNPEI